MNNRNGEREVQPEGAPASADAEANPISRRTALATIGAGAAATAAGGAALAATPDRDAALLARVAEFHRAYRESASAWAASGEARDRVKALPDCPTLPVLDKAHYDRWAAFLSEHGCLALTRQADDLSKLTGAAANAVFAIPAQTIRGAVEKLKIVRLSAGDNFQGDIEGDENLCAYQDYDAPWFPTVIADLERLAGRVVA